MAIEHSELQSRIDTMLYHMRREEYDRTCSGAEPEHLQPPISLLPENALADTDDATALETVANVYFGTMPDVRYAQLTDRVAALRENDSMPATGKLPTGTICVSVAMGETEQTLAHTLKLASKQAGAETAEVLLYANYNADIVTDPTQIADRQAMLARLKAGAMQSENPLHVRDLLQGYPKDELSISHIRKDVTDMVALDIRERGGGYQYPVIWLDADNTNLAPGLLAAHINQHQTNGRSLALATTQNYFSMNDPGHEYQPGGTAQKLAVYNEVLRRHASHRISDLNADPYPQENGLSFSIGTYLLVGGLNTGDKLGEARHLLTAIDGHIRSGQAARVLGDMAVTRRVDLPPHLRAYSSGRRQVGHAQQHLTQGRRLTNRVDNTEPYTTHSHDAFTGSDDSTMRAQNISHRAEQPATSPDLIRQHVHAITSEYRPARPADPAEAAYFAFASRIIERLGLTELAEITEVTPDVHP